MQKIGVITINDFNNYGNRLQCYAVQRYLENMGFLVENIYNENTNDNAVINFGKKWIRYLRNFSKRKTIAVRNQNFHQFNKRIHFSEDRIINGKYDKALNEKYDFFVTGSDQVWNPYDSGRSEIDFLSFASDEKKISFSASIGADSLPDCVKEKYKDYLKNFKSISVRENSARQIIEDITGRNDVALLVDPTMLLAVEDWEEVSLKPNDHYSSNYILSYFLGGSKEYEPIIRSIAETYSCEIIDIYDKNSEFYTCGPQQFLHLEKNAFLVCTDSFHSAVFAFLFNTPFISFDRKNTKINMNARMEAFLSDFGLESRKYDAGCHVEEYLKSDYSLGYKILEQKRQEAKTFFVRAFS